MSNKNEVIQNISIDAISDPASPARSRFDNFALDNLVRSIRLVGVLSPLIVRRSGKGYEVIAGHRRLCASRMAGLASVPCLVVNVRDDQADAIKLHENLNREDLGISDEADFISRYMNVHKLGLPEMAKVLSRSEGYVRNRLDFLNYPQELKDAVENGKVSFSAAMYLGKITDLELRAEYIHFAIAGGISTHIAKQWYHDFKTGKLERRVKDQIRKDEQSGKTTIVPFVTCQLCGGDIEMGQQRVIMVHDGCLKEFQRVAQSVPEKHD